MLKTKMALDSWSQLHIHPTILPACAHLLPALHASPGAVSSPKPKIYRRQQYPKHLILPFQLSTRVTPPVHTSIPTQHNLRTLSYTFLTASPSPQHAAPTSHPRTTPTHHAIRPRSVTAFHQQPDSFHLLKTSIPLMTHRHPLARGSNPSAVHQPPPSSRPQIRTFINPNYSGLRPPPLASLTLYTPENYQCASAPHLYEYCS